MKLTAAEQTAIQNNIEFLEHNKFDEFFEACHVDLNHTSGVSNIAEWLFLNVGINWLEYLDVLPASDMYSDMIKHLSGKVKTLHIPANIREVEGKKYGGSSLKSFQGTVIFDNPNCRLGEDVFRCADVIHVSLPSNLITLPANCFKYAENLEEIDLPTGLKEVDYEAFYGCTKLKALTLPDSVSMIGYGVFSGLEIPIKLPGNFECHGGLYRGYKGPGPFVIPSTFTIKDMTDMFHGSAVQNIQLPEHLTEIADDMFYACVNLKDIKIPNTVKVIGREAFFDSSLAQVELPAGLKTIKQDAFWGMNNLTSITIPASVKLIGQEAFAWCTNLQDIKFEGDIHKIKIAKTAFRNTLVEDKVKAMLNSGV